ncbi:hypothetical protein [Streptomyces sp. NPDC001312]
MYEVDVVVAIGFVGKEVPFRRRYTRYPARSISLFLAQPTFVDAVFVL